MAVLNLMFSSYDVNFHHHSLPQMTFLTRDQVWQDFHFQDHKKVNLYFIVLLIPFYDPAIKPYLYQFLFFCFQQLVQQTDHFHLVLIDYIQYSSCLLFLMRPLRVLVFNLFIPLSIIPQVFKDLVFDFLLYLFELTFSHDLHQIMVFLFSLINYWVHHS